MATGQLTANTRKSLKPDVEPNQAPHSFVRCFSVSALAALMAALFTVFVMLGAGFAAIVLAVPHDRMLTKLAVAFRTVTFTVIGHGADSFCGGRRGLGCWPVLPV